MRIIPTVRGLLSYIVFFLLFVLWSSPAAAENSAPHNSCSNISCGSCHSDALLSSPFWGSSDEMDYNRLCLLNCHNATSPPYTDTCAPQVKTHSSENTSSQYGTWTILCIQCHEPHFHQQLYWKSANAAELYLMTGEITGYSYDAESGSSTLQTASTEFKSGWDATALTCKTSEGRRTVLFPNMRKSGSSFTVIAVDDPDPNTITVKGDVSSVYQFVSPPTDFIIIYGEYIRQYVEADESFYPVKFFDRTGTGSFVDSDSSYNGICQVCHTQTRHFRRIGVGGAVDQEHDNVGGAAEEDCTACHKHANGFAHGGGPGVGCDTCHGHDSGYEYEPGIYSQGRGSSQTHSTHTEDDADDAMGPHVGCDTCHDTNNFPYFKSGTDDSGDGLITLDETDVCDTCHSPGGTYDGVNDPVFGAKNNWKTSIYVATDDPTLQSGKEKWCASCHDEEPAQISGVSAPNVIGDEDGVYTYGVGWGFYKTGHGLAAGETFPSKGGIETLSGRPFECAACHEYSSAHIDGVARTFDCGPAGDRLNCDATEYRTSYRLKLVGAEEPMIVPWRAGTSDRDPSYFRLCAQCHVTTSFTDGNNTHTNFYTWRDSDSDGDIEWVNRHAYHVGLGGTNSTYPADYAFDDGGNSRVTCVACHNVHGSTRLAMVRDGKLINREPGLKIWYFDEDTVPTGYAGPWPVAPPIPENVTLADSIGTFWWGATSINLCNHCHAWPATFKERCEPVDDPFDDPDLGVEPDCSSSVPPFQTSEMEPSTLEWTGENGYADKGVEPDTGFSKNLFMFRVKYTNAYNDAPWTIQLWIDKDDDGSYENNDSDPAADEKIDLDELDPNDSHYTDGKLFFAELILDKAGDNSLSYRFHVDGAWGETVELPAPPDPDGTVTVNNNTPMLAWSGEAYFESDGVHPNHGGLGGDYQFRVSYSDADNECPVSGSSAIQVWIDEDDDGYEEGEKHNLSEASSADTDCIDGKIYTLTRALSTAGAHNFRFYASDGTDAVMGEAGPLADNPVTVNAAANTPPQIDWYEGGCVTQGVMPVRGAAGEDFEFDMVYTDPDGCPAPGIIQVWIDLGGDGFDAGDQHDMIEEDPLDGDCSDGKVYRYRTSIDSVGTYTYRFHASDGTDNAIGEATTEASVEAIHADFVVYPGAGTPIQDAIGDDRIILVYEGTYSENIVMLPWTDNMTLQSVCGAEMTIIEAADGSLNTVNFNTQHDSVIDGFTITGGDNGIAINGKPTVKNCIIENNHRGIYSPANSSVLTLEDTVIRQNETTGSGAGIYFSSGGPHTISGSEISGNHAGGSGGGVFIQNNSEALSITGTTVSGNQADAWGGGIYVTHGLVDLNKVIVRDNSSSGGGGIYLKDGTTAALINSNIVDNISSGAGGGIFLGNYNSLPIDLTMTNCTVSNNGLTDPTAGYGGGLYNLVSNATIVNSIFWGNAAGSGHEVFNVRGTTSLTWSNVMDNSNALRAINGGVITTDANRIEADPQFVNANNGDYHLKSISPVIDQGTAIDAPIDDIDGDDRPAGSGYDMGADEYVP